MNARKLLLLIAAALLLSATPAFAAPKGNCTVHDATSRPDCSGALAFYDQFKAALEKNNHASVVRLVHFPLRATIGGKVVHLHGADELLARYDEVFTPAVRCAVHNSTPDDVWGNYQGFMVGNGAVWFDGIIPPHDKLGVNAPNYWTLYPFKAITVNSNAAAGACKQM